MVVIAALIVLPTRKGWLSDAPTGAVRGPDLADAADRRIRGLAGPARQDLCKHPLRALPCDRAHRREPVRAGAAVPHPAPALPDRIAWRSARRGHQHRPSRHAGIRARTRPDPRPAVVSEDAGIDVLPRKTRKPRQPEVLASASC